MFDIANRSRAFVGEPDEDGAELYTPLCYSCKHKLNAITCKAYPEGIPVAIVLGYIDHKKSNAGDKGIVYEEK